jgi:hypothetical protein
MIKFAKYLSPISTSWTKIISASWKSEFQSHEIWPPDQCPKQKIQFLISPKPNLTFLALHIWKKKYYFLFLWNPLKNQRHNPSKQNGGWNNLFLRVGMNWSNCNCSTRDWSTCNWWTLFGQFDQFSLLLSTAWIRLILLVEQLSKKWKLVDSVEQLYLLSTLMFKLKNSIFYL